MKTDIEVRKIRLTDKIIRLSCTDAEFEETVVQIQEFNTLDRLDILKELALVEYFQKDLFLTVIFLALNEIIVEKNEYAKVIEILKIASEKVGSIENFCRDENREFTLSLSGELIKTFFAEMKDCSIRDKIIYNSAKKIDDIEFLKEINLQMFFKILNENDLDCDTDLLFEILEKNYDIAQEILKIFEKKMNKSENISYGEFVDRDRLNSIIFKILNVLLPSKSPNIVIKQSLKMLDMCKSKDENKIREIIELDAVSCILHLRTVKNEWITYDMMVTLLQNEISHETCLQSGGTVKNFLHRNVKILVDHIIRDSPVSDGSNFIKRYRKIFCDIIQKNATQDVLDFLVFLSDETLKSAAKININPKNDVDLAELLNSDYVFGIILYKINKLSIQELFPLLDLLKRMKNINERLSELKVYFLTTDKENREMFRSLLLRVYGIIKDKFYVSLLESEQVYKGEVKLLREYYNI